MKASWSGYFRLGELTVPMRLYSGTRSIAPHYVQLHQADHSPVTRVMKCKKDEQELTTDEIVRAIEYNGQYVEVTDKEIDASGVADKDIIVRQFSKPSQISSAYYEKPYYMVPSKGGELAYTILRQAFTQSGMVAVVRFKFYDKEHIGIISAVDGMLILQQLRFAAEIVPKSDIKTPSLPQPSPGQVATAVQLMERYAAPFYVDDYQNEQIETIHELIERKAKGLPMRRKQKPAPHTTPEDQLSPIMRSLLNPRAPYSARLSS